MCAMSKAATARNVDEYITMQPLEIRPMLEELRAHIMQAAPDAEEVISYQMPAYKQQGMLVYFAAFKNHIGFYPTSSGTAAFKKELSAYEGSKGTVRFPLDKKLPLALIKKIVKFRVKENLAKASNK